jgi:hypothetical protein
MTQKLLPRHFVSVEGRCAPRKHDQELHSHPFSTPHTPYTQNNLCEAHHSKTNVSWSSNPQKLLSCKQT